MQTLLVHNPTAGKGDHEKEELLAILRLAGHEVTYASSKSDEFPKILDGEFDLIVIAGGDGTVRKVATRLRHRKAAIAIFPHGTANNIARSLGMTGDRQEMANAWRKGEQARLDIGLASGPWGRQPFIEGVGIGALASTTNDEVGADFEGDKRILIGRASFREALEKAEPLDIKITVDGKPFEGRWLMVEVMNNRYTGPALQLAPKAESGDGLLEIVGLAADRREEMLEWLGAPDDSQPPLETKRGKLVDMIWTGKPVLRIDDSPVDIPRSKQRVEIAFQEDPLKVMSMTSAGAKKPAAKKRTAGKSVARKADGKGGRRSLEAA
jgi:diacylglycerol kinase family enzyme